MAPKKVVWVPTHKKKVFKPLALNRSTTRSVQIPHSSVTPASISGDHAHFQEFVKLINHMKISANQKAKLLKALFELCK
jgi:hypothetical protein